MPVVFVALASVVMASTAVGVQNQAPVAEAARQVTSNPAAARAHAVPVVAVDPRDPRVVVIAEAEAYTSRCSLHVSTDGGMSWRTAAIEPNPQYPGCVYSNFGPIVDVAFDSGGTLHYAYSGFDPKTYHQRIFLARTSDLGRTFETTMLPWVEPDLARGQFGGDALPSVAVDPARPERVAVGWMTNNGTWNVSSEVLQGNRYYYDVFSRPYVAASTDGGKTFSEALDVAPAEIEGGKSRGWMNEPHLVAGNDGALYAFYGENMRPIVKSDGKVDPVPQDSPELAPPAHLWMSVSRDWGKTWSPTAVQTREAKKRDWLGQPSPAVDPQTGHLYVAWDDQPEAEVPARIAFMRSTDGGKTWSQPQKVNDVDPKRTWTFCEFCPSMDVAPSGRIDVAWYDWRNDVAFDESMGADATNTFQDVYYTYSTDGGRTWAANVRVSDRSIDRRLGVWDTYGLHGNIGLASTDAAALVTWDDTRNGNETTHAQDVYFTRVRHAEPLVAETSGQPGLLWALIGAGAALALGGIILFLATRTALRPRPEAVRGP